MFVREGSMEGRQNVEDTVMTTGEEVMVAQAVEGDTTMKIMMQQAVEVMSLVAEIMTMIRVEVAIGHLEAATGASETMGEAAVATIKTKRSVRPAGMAMTKTVICSLTPCLSSARTNTAMMTSTSSR